MLPKCEALIFNLRDVKVMIDADLAALYGVATKALKQQVRRNIDRFPGDFMFELTLKEKKELVTSCDRLAGLKHSSVKPLAFTEQGVSMLSSVLRSPEAIQVSIEIMRAFVRYRIMIKENEALKKEIKAVDRKLNKISKRLLKRIDELQGKKPEPMRLIGFKTSRSD